MSDNLKPEDRLKTMRAVKGKGTKLERRLWAMLAGMRLRGWRKNADDVAGKPDIVFDAEHLAIFIDGCFWHACPYCKRKMPVANRDYWERKVRRNAELAGLYNEELRQAGWAVIRIWEHQMKDLPSRQRISAQIRDALQGKVNGPRE